MFNVGFDSIALKKEFTPLDNDKEDEEGDTKTHNFTAFLGASITSSYPDFSEEYLTTISDIFEQFGIKRKKQIYKGAHLLKQLGENAEGIICSILDTLEPIISHIDIYCAYYSRKYLSIFGRAQGQRLKPMDFIKKNKNSFDHVCAWWYNKTYSKFETDYLYQIDHFEGKTTPAWRELRENKANMKVFYSGSECNCLISLSDLVLKLIEVFHFGNVNQRSLARPILNKCRNFVRKNKVRAHNLGKLGWVIRASSPDTPLDIDLTDHIKHPIYFIAWSPELPRKRVKPSFEWSNFYNTIISKAIESNGCVKFLDFDKDMLFWDDSDYIVPWCDVDSKHVKLLQNMGFEKMPSITPISELKG